MTDTIISEVLDLPDEFLPKQKRNVVHPEFIPGLDLWFEPRSGEMAKSLRELRRKLPEGTRIKGYYPKGYGLIVRPKAVYKMPIEELGRTPTITEIRKAVPEPEAREVIQSSDGGARSSLPSGESEPVVTQAYPPSEPKPRPVEIQPMVKFVQPKRRLPKKQKLKPGQVDWPQYVPLLRKLAELGLSMTEIAKQIPNATKGAIAGRGRRLGIKFKGIHGPAPGSVKEKDVVEET